MKVNNEIPIPSKILVVDDELIVAVNIQRTLEKYGYVVVGPASDADEATHLVKTNHPDLILMDINLKNSIDGIETSEIIKELTDIPIIFVTAYSDDATIQRAKKVAPYSYLIKPFDNRELFSTIEMALYRHKMERNLRESEKRFRLMYENSPLSYQSLDANAILIDVNPTWLSSLGYERDEVIGHHFSEFMTPESAELIKTRLPYFIETGEIHNFEFEMVKKNGEHIFVSYEGKIGLDELGHFKQTHCIWSDITERKLYEKRMIEQEAHTRAIFDAAPMAMILLDEHTSLVSVNKSVEKIFNKKSEDLLKLQPGDALKCIVSYNNNEGCGHSPECKFCQMRLSVKELFINERPIKNKEINVTFVIDGNPVKMWIELNAELVTLDNKKYAVVGFSDITKRKESELALQQSEERYRNLVEGSPDIFYRFSTKKGGIYWSAKAYEILGYPSNQLQINPKIWHDSIDEKDVEKVDQAIIDGCNGKYYEVEYKIKDANGNIHWFNDRYIGRIINGDEIILEGLATDITDRIKDQIKIRESEELFRNAFITSPDAVNINTLDEGIYVNINEGFTNLTGYTEEDVIGKSSKEINIWADPLDRDKLVEGLKKFGTVQNLEARYKMKDGKVLTGLMSASVLNLNQKPHILSITRDITEIKKFEDSLKQSEEKYRVVADNTTDWIYWLDQNKEFKYISPSVLNITGYSQFEFKANPSLITDIIFEVDRGNVLSHFENILEEKSPICTKEFRIITKHGHIKWIYHRCRAVRDTKGNYLGRRSSNRDITELKEAEIRLVESEHKYRSFFENDLTGDYISTVEGKLLSCNQSFVDIFGFRNLDEAMNYDASKLYKDDKSRDTLIKLLKEKKSLVNFEYEYKKISGEKLYLIENMIGIFNDFGELVQIQGYVFDNTKRKIAELEIKESEERFKGLFENAKLGIYRGKPDGELLYGNKALVETLGYKSLDELKKIKATELYVNIEDREKFKMEMETKGYVSGFEELFYKGDESIIIISESAHTVKDSSGNVIYYEGILEDITEKRENINLIKMQADLLFNIQSETDIDKILNLAVSSVVSINPFDSCGIYLIEGENLILKNNLGLSDKFIDEVKLIKPGSPQFMLLKDKNPIFADYSKLKLPKKDPGHVEGIKEIAVIPLVLEEKLIGCLNAGVHKDFPIKESAKNALISIGSILSEIISRINVFNELQESEERFRLVFENEINGFAYHEIITDKNGKPIDYRFLNINKGFENIVQKNADEIIGKTVLEIWPDMEMSWIEKYGEVALKQNPISFENYSAPLKKYFHVNAFAPIKGFFAVSFNDITTRVEQEQKIRKLQRAVEQSQVSIVITDTDGNIEYVNPKFEEVTGYKADEVIGNNPRILNSGEYPKDFYTNMWNELTSGKDWNGLFYNKRKNGELFWESANITPIKNNDGEITNYIAVKEDITEKIKSEEELNEYKLHLENLVEERTGQLKSINKKLAEEIKKQKEIDKKLQDQINMLSTFIESMPTATFIKDSNLKYIEVNQAFEELSGKNKSQIIGKTVFDVFQKDVAKTMNAHDKEILKEKNLKTFNLKMLTHNNVEKHFMIKKTIFQNAHGEIGGILGTYIDISEHKMLQESIERNLESEKELNELKSRFISMASHEFRTPLTSIRIFTDLIVMQNGKYDKEKLAEYTEKIQNSVSYMTDLINDVLTMSRVETGKLKYEPENIDLNSFVNELINEAKLTAFKNHNFILNIKTNKKVIFADPKLLRYIISNLLSNAVKYSPNGGDIDSIIDYKNSDLIITVKDNGIGMSELVMKNLFEPFLRGDNIGNIQGTGLGLSIIKKAVDLHKGRIDCESKLKKGTKFSVTIPIIEE